MFFGVLSFIYVMLQLNADEPLAGIPLIGLLIFGLIAWGVVYFVLRVAYPDGPMSQESPSDAPSAATRACAYCGSNHGKADSASCARCGAPTINS